MKYKKIKNLVISIVVATSMFTTTVTSATVATTSVGNSDLSTQDSVESDKGVLKVTIDENGNYSYTEPVGAATSDENKLFSWSNATVYFVLTDRFENGDPSNDHSYGRSLDANGNVISGYKDAAGTFHGGDLKGLTKKINEGYFTDLGINAIWFTAPYEQIHGYTSGNLKASATNPAGEDGSGFSYYGYHGYWALDFSALDKNMGTRDESVEVSAGKADDMRDFVNAAHTKGIRVIMDVVMNHVGYATLKDVQDFGFGEANSNWKDYYYGQESNRKGGDWETANCYKLGSSKWADWWGPDWIRINTGISGYAKGGPDSDEKTSCLGGLPDIYSEMTAKEVSVPKFLKTKWQNEGRLDTEMASIDAFFKDSGLKRTPENYIVKWLSDWVKDYGIDGFRADTAKHIEIENWGVLKDQAQKALTKWRQNNPDAPGAKWTDKFWMTGECYGLGVNLGVDYYSNGFDSMINFAFPIDGATGKLLEATYKLNGSVNSTTGSSRSTLSYISSHDTTLGGRNDLYLAGTTLLLSPGGVQIYYGDETARTLHSAPWGWKDLLTRTDMNWNTIDKGVQAHWQKLAKFRSNHLAVGGGVLTKISTDSDKFYASKREYKDANNNKDTVVCVSQASGTITLDVSSAFTEGTELRDAYTGKTAKVGNDGKVTFTADPKGVILMEKTAAPVNTNPGPIQTTSNLVGGNISTSPDESQELGNDVEITTAAATGGDGGYTYEFLVDGAKVQDFSASKTATWTPEEDGEYTIKVISKDKSGNTVTKILGYKISPKSDNPVVTELKAGNVTTSPEDSQEAGKPVEITTTAATGGTGGYTYQFAVDGVKIQEYSDNKTVTWTPPEEGSYTIKVTAKDKSGKTVEKILKFDALAKSTNVDSTDITISSFKTDVATAKVGDTINLSASATGDTNINYAFEVSGQSTETLSNKSDNSAEWIPTEAGGYTLKVTAKGDSNKEVEKTIAFTIENADNSDIPKIPSSNALALSLATDKQGTQNANTTIKLTASATGGASGYKYEFSVNDKSIQSSSTKNYVNWTPVEAGTYKLKVNVTDANGDSKSVEKLFTIAEKSTSSKSDTSDSNTILAISIMAMLSGIGMISIRHKKKIEL